MNLCWCCCCGRAVGIGAVAVEEKGFGGKENKLFIYFREGKNNILMRCRNK
jgi:hypothetical protein